MRKQMMIGLASLFLLACSNGKKMGELEPLQKASEKTAAIQNGTYVVTERMQSEIDDSHVVTEGVFEKEGKSSNEYTKQVVGEEATRIQYEQLKIDQTIYERFAYVNEDGDFVGPDLKTVVDEPAFHPPLIDSTDWFMNMQMLTELSLEEADFSEIVIEPRKGATIYHLTYSKEALNELQQTDIQDAEKELAETQQENPEAPSLGLLKLAVWNRKETKYLEKKLTLKINEAGLLTGYQDHFVSSHEEAGITEREKVVSMELTGYDLENVEFPVPE